VHLYSAQSAIPLMCCNRARCTSTCASQVAAGIIITVNYSTVLLHKGGDVNKSVCCVRFTSMELNTAHQMVRECGDVKYSYGLTVSKQSQNSFLPYQ